MGFDLLGQLFGKDRRRQIEGQAVVALKPVLQRLGFGLGAASAVAVAQPAMLTTKAGLAGLAATFLAGAVPAGSAPAGILTPTADGSPSLAQVAVQGVLTLISAPAERRQAQATALMQQLATQAVQASLAEAAAKAAGQAQTAQTVLAQSQQIQAAGQNAEGNS